MIFKRLSMACECILAVIFILILLKYSCLLTDTPHLFSKSLAHRLQTDALLKGHLAVSPLPFGAQIDFYWAGHGLQQVWGLGVPFLRFPFEWLAMHLGLAPFPDRLVMWIYLALTIALLHRAIGIIQALDGGLENGWKILIRWMLLAWIFFSPAMGILVKQQISNVYHETIFYACLYTYFLLALFWITMTKINEKLFIVLCLAAGLGWLIRPTLIAYGGTTFILAGIYFFNLKRNFDLIMKGFLCFCLGIVIELWCNAHRFGSMLDFGQGANFSSIPILNYSLRFDYPFHKEPLGSAAKELLGALFFNNAWPSQTIRYRWGFAGYTEPFNMLHLACIGLGLFLFVSWGVSRFREIFNSSVSSNPPLRIIFYSLSWGLVNFCLLFGFYVHTLYIQSRYLSEFSPAINAIVMALILGCIYYLTGHFKGRGFGFLSCMALVLIFFIGNNQFFKSEDQKPPYFLNLGFTDKNGIARLMDEFNQGLLQRPNLPAEAYCGQSHPQQAFMFNAYPYHGINYQYNGWNVQGDCSVYAVTSVFFPGKKCLSLDYTINASQALPDLQVKRDLSYLKSVVVKNNSLNTSQVEMTQRFCSDETPRSSEALYSIGWVSVDGLNALGNHLLPIKLNWIKVSDS